MLGMIITTSKQMVITYLWCIKMTKITFEEWKNDYEDIPYIKQNYKKIHEEHGIPKECINGGDDLFNVNSEGEVDQHTTICVRVFKHGGYYEILLNSKYYLVLGNEDWLEEKPDVIEKELYEWCNGEIFNTEEN